jgi:predicted AAA+ superfamily ATPase
LHPLSADIPGYEEHHPALTSLFYEYLLHGGYLPAINEYNLKKTISKGVMNTYIQWIVGDILKHNKSEHYLFEILKGIKTTYNTPISWNNLSRFLSIEHHKTIADYCDILVSSRLSRETGCTRWK